MVELAEGTLRGTLQLAQLVLDAGEPLPGARSRLAGLRQLRLGSGGALA